ncbi:MAG: rRNA maturation RNase YbeY [Clostridia bacterium]|nr:rRNA maturation RNase YbeY [Clostridia bacterium]MBR7159786.1 rRNA maturation RNase YbeY [Clostridia bacterium]
MSIYVYSDEDIDVSLIEKVYKAVLDYVGQREEVLVELSTCTQDEIRQVNKDSRGVDKVTDVLSFPALPLQVGEVATSLDYPDDIDLDSGEIMLGEVLICMDVAKAQAIEYGHTTQREIAYLTVHSLLHLYGYDHMLETDKAIMRQAEENILTKINITRD